MGEWHLKKPNRICENQLTTERNQIKHVLVSQRICPPRWNSSYASVTRQESAQYLPDVRLASHNWQGISSLFIYLEILYAACPDTC